jgi:hypothetical protein
MDGTLRAMLEEACLRWAIILGLCVIALAWVIRPDSGDEFD